MNTRRSFLRSILGAIAFSPVVCKLADKFSVSVEKQPEFTNFDSVTQAFIEETSKIPNMYRWDIYGNEVTTWLRSEIP